MGGSDTMKRIFNDIGVRRSASQCFAGFEKDIWVRFASLDHIAINDLVKILDKAYRGQVLVNDMGDCAGCNGQQIPLAL